MTRATVLVKQVPDTDGPRRIGADGRVVRDDGRQVLDEPDERALEFALTQRDAGRLDEVTALAMGPVQAADALRFALAMGADRGVHVCDDALAGADVVTTARMLSAVVVAERPDLVVAGESSSDGGGAVVAALVAELAGLPLLAGLASCEMDAGALTGTRPDEGALVSLRTPLPAVVALTDRFPQGRLPGLRGVLRARRKPVRTLGLADLGGAPEPVMRVVGARQQPRRRAGVRIEDDGSAAARMIDFLAERRLI